MNKLTIVNTLVPHSLDCNTMHLAQITENATEIMENGKCA